MQTYSRRSLLTVALVGAACLHLLTGCGGGGGGAMITRKVVLNPTETFKGSDVKYGGYFVTYPVDSRYLITLLVNGTALPREEYGADIYIPTELRVAQTLAPDANVTIQYTSQEMNREQFAVTQAAQTTFRLADHALSLSVQVETTNLDGTKTQTRLSDAEVGFTDNTFHIVQVMHALPVPSTVIVYYVPGVQVGEF